MKVSSRKGGGSVFVPYVSNFSYAASGGISQMRLGNGRWETAKFNERMQVTELGLGASATDAGVWKTNYEYGELQTNGTVDTSKNTGNIARQTLTVPGTSFVQSYTYDSLHRLTEAVEKTGLAFAEARYYYNNHGRFTAVDPLLASGKSANPQTFNRYAYTMNRPLVLTDHTGLQAGKNTERIKEIIRQEIGKPYDLIDGVGSITLDDRSVEKIVSALLPTVQRQYDLSFAAQNALNAQQNTGSNITTTSNSTTTTAPTTITASGSGTVEVHGQDGVEGVGARVNVEGGASLTTTIAPGTSTSTGITASPSSPQALDQAAAENLGTANVEMSRTVENTTGLSGTVMRLNPADSTVSASQTSVNLVNMAGRSASILRDADQAGRQSANQVNPVDPTKKIGPQQ